MSFKFKILWILSIPLLTAIIIAACSLSRHDKVIIAYVFPADRLLTADEIDATKLTHINYAFANIANGQAVEGFAYDSANLATLVGIRSKHPHLKILISVGGWTWSGYFSDAALTQEGRERFAASAVNLVKKHNLDGLDLDWEYPGMPGYGNVHRPEDKENFTLLLKECRRKLCEAESGGQKYLLTIAAGAFPDYIANTDMRRVAQHVDWVNIMSYDFKGEWDSITGHHANLYEPAYLPNQNSTSRSVQLFTDAGVDPHQLVVGAAFYGRAWRGVIPTNKGLGQPAKGGARLNLSYRNIAGNLLKNKQFEQHWDSVAMAPYLWRESDSTFVTFENPESIRCKAKFVKEKGLRGVMFWEYSSDYQLELVNAINKVLEPDVLKE